MLNLLGSALQVKLTIADTTLTIADAKCECAKALGKACSHIGALLYDIAHLKKLGRKVIPTDPVKTSQPQTWHMPRGERVSGTEVQDIVAHGYNKRRGPMEEPQRAVKSTLYNPLRTEFPSPGELTLL